MSLTSYASDAIDYALKEKADYVDVRVENEFSNFMGLRNNKICGVNTNLQKGIGVRVLFKNCWGFASTASLDNTSIKRIVDSAINNAKKISKISSRSKGKISNSNKIGNAAIIYSMLRVSPEKNVVFNPEQAVKFEGDTGPYQLYTYARINSLLKKSNNGNVNSKLVNESELDLIKFIAKFPNITEKAMLTKKTNLVPNYCSELCQKFNSYYSRNIIISDDKNLTNHRIGLIKLVKQVIENSMFIMGIETIKEM